VVEPSPATAEITDWTDMDRYRQRRPDEEPAD